MKKADLRCIHFEDHDGDKLSERIEDWLDNELFEVQIVTCNYSTLLTSPWDGPDGSEWIYSALIFYKELDE